MSSDEDDDDSDRSLDASVPSLENGPGSENSSNESDDDGAFAREFFEETDTELLHFTVLPCELLFRNGFAMHAAACSATALPIGIALHQGKDTCLMAYLRMLRSPLGQNCGDGEALDLSNVAMGSDQGYLIQSVVVELLRFGTEIIGVVQCSHWVPFTFAALEAQGNQVEPQNLLSRFDADQEKGMKESELKCMDCVCRL